MRTLDVVKMLLGSVTIYAVVAACSGGAAGSKLANADNVSGTRLKAQHYQGSDGSSFSIGTFIDSSTGKQCQFAAIGSGIEPGASVASGQYQTVYCIPFGVDPATANASDYVSATLTTDP